MSISIINYQLSISSIIHHPSSNPSFRIHPHSEQTKHSNLYFFPAHSLWNSSHSSQLFQPGQSYFMTSTMSQGHKVSGWQASIQSLQLPKIEHLCLTLRDPFNRISECQPMRFGSPNHTKRTCQRISWTLGPKQMSHLFSTVNFKQL